MFIQSVETIENTRYTCIFKNDSLSIMPKQRPDQTTARKHYVNLKMDADEYRELAHLARQDARSVTNYVLIIIRRHLIERSRSKEQTERQCQQ